MRASVIVFPGSNREHDAVAALKAVGFSDVRTVWHRDSALPDADLILIPGGFAYGDYLRTGAIAAHSPIMREVKLAAARGVHVLGLCNGFQILCESGLLPGMLLRNASLRFVCRDVTLRVETSRSPFTAAYNAGQLLRVPVAHGDGNYTAAADVVKQLEDEDRVAFRYCNAAGQPDPDAVNGSVAGIAGILSQDRKVLGMMPHPENAIDPLVGSIDGLGLFRSLNLALAA